MNKKNKIVFVTSIILCLCIAIFAKLHYRDQIMLDRSLGEEYVQIDDRGQLYRIDKQIIESIGIIDIRANLKTNGMKAIKQNYQGVPFNKVLLALGIDGAQAEKFVFLGQDGYVTAFSKKEILEDGNIYLVTGLDGQPLLGRKKGGMGPFLIISTKDIFSQRWCKYLMEINMQ